MANTIVISVGQCGNQLFYDVLSQIGQHLNPDAVFTPNSSSSKPKQPVSNNAHDDNIEKLIRNAFRPSYDTQNEFDVARLVCLDTEPKVINDCLSRRCAAITSPTDATFHNKKKAIDTNWQYDPKCIAYRHGGAGNNWSLGYSMATGEFLEISLNCIRRQLEHTDHIPNLMFCHSLAGGTGSGLGTHLTECAIDEFNDCFHSNLVIAPHHFGEVVVQHYNALLCLSKIQAITQSVIILENKTAQNLCRQMRGIERPSLQDFIFSVSKSYSTSLYP